MYPPPVLKYKKLPFTKEQSKRKGQSFPLYFFMPALLFKHGRHIRFPIYPDGTHAFPARPP